MKHTGKPPKNTRSRPAAAGKTFSAKGKSSHGKSGAKGPVYRKPRNERGKSEDSLPRSATKTPRKDGRGAHGVHGEDRRSPKSASKPVKNQMVRAATPQPRAPREKRASIGPKANLFGLHAVREAWLNPKRYIHALYLSESAEIQFAPVLEQARRKGLERPEPKILSREEFDRLLGRDVVHQGIALSAAPQGEVFLQDILSVTAHKDRSIILMLDQVTDPHNVGAILRSACAFGADGVVMQRRHAPELEGVLAKTACGATEHIPVAYETNLSRSLQELSDSGYVIIGLDEHAGQSLGGIETPEKAVLVLGAEGDGMRRLIREHCDVLVTLPTRAPIASLNVSNAAAVALYALLPQVTP